MKKLLAMLLALIMVLSLAACTTPAPVESEAPETSSEPAAEPEPEPASPVTYLALDGWDETVKKGVNDMFDAYGMYSEGYDENAKPYVVFDFDNTCSIFDVEEQLAVYQLQVMAFAFAPEELAGILETEIGDHAEPREGYASDEQAHSYNDWIADIVAAYTYLYTTYGPFTAAGLDEATQATVQADPQWAEFATKMRAMYDLVYDNESASVAYPWVLYWFTGMTEDEVYALATASHTMYKAVETSEVTWTSPADITSKVGVVEYTWTSGTQVSDNVVELWAALKANGFDVYVCSASATDPIRAAVDVWGMRDYCDGVIAMTNTVTDGKYFNSYDYTSGCAWLVENGEWVRDTAPTKAQTQGVGKVTAVENVLVSKYGYGPIAGFMDSTGDFNFCTEFDSLKLVICFNRASRKITDGGGIAAIAAVYQADVLGYDFAAADAAGDIYFVLQGRDETGMRTLSGTRETLRYGKDAPLLWRDGAEGDVQKLYDYVAASGMSTAELINRFAVKTATDAEGNDTGLKYGCVSSYDGYKTLKYAANEAGWDATVQQAINDFSAANGIFSADYNADAKPYVVFDFDNTCSIFDVEEQLAVYQLQVMAFAFAPEELAGILETEIGDHAEPREGYASDEQAHSYNDWIADIVAAYTYLYTTYGPFTAAGLDEATQATVQADPQWAEFATKMRAMYDLVYDNESASVAYPWVLYWFTGMTEDEVYALATASHSTYKAVETSTVVWTSPADIESKVGVVEYEWTSGTQVSDNVVELWQVLNSNGIDVYVCSASATDPIRAAVDVWGMRDYCKGVIAMTNTVTDGKYFNSYDYTSGCAWLVENGEWVRDTAPTKAQTQGVGKVTAVQNVLVSKYGYGPIAGFMDSTGDFNFCTEFDSLQLVICFNRASRKITDGGGLAAIAAVYEADNLGYDYAAAMAAGDIYFVLQGRDETGMRTLSGTRETLRYGKDAPMLFANDDVQTLYQYVVDNNLTIADFLNTFAVKTAADAEGNPIALKFGCVSEYAGYKNIK